MTSAERAVVIRGTSDPADVAAVVAVLAAGVPRDAPVTGYESWRAKRLKALRHKGMQDSDGL